MTDIINLVFSRYRFIGNYRNNNATKPETKLTNSQKMSNYRYLIRYKGENKYEDIENTKTSITF